MKLKVSPMNLPRLRRSHFPYLLAVCLLGLLCLLPLQAQDSPKPESPTNDSQAKATPAQDSQEKVDVNDVTYYVGHETVIHRDDGAGLPAWQERFFAVMERNAIHVSDFFSLPTDQVVEIGRQVAI